MQKDIAERLKDFPTLVKLAMLGDPVSAQAIEVFSRNAMLEIEGLRADLKNIATQKTTDELKAEGEQEYEDAAADGLLEPMQRTFGQRFSVTVTGWQLTHAGRLLYCSNC